MERIGYKLFRKKRDGYAPLYFCKRDRYQLGETYRAVDGGPKQGFAHRPGFHIFRAPYAPQIKRSTHGETAWVEVAYEDVGEIHRRPLSQGGNCPISPRIRLLREMPEPPSKKDAARRVRLSKPGKLDNIRSWSLPPISTCPGAHGPDGQLVEVCTGCYALEGRYPMGNVQEPREHNRQDWQRDGWVDDMVALLWGWRYFRWFDSGDIYDWRLGLKILTVIQRTPWVQHWLPTRSHKVPHLRLIIEMIDREPNVVVRRSMDNVDDDPPEHGHAALVVSRPRDDVYTCPATTSRKQCDGCRACWDPNVRVVAYLAHGSLARRQRHAA